MENISNFTEAKEEVDQFLERLWRFYHFTGNPPQKDSPAEKRLKNACSQYTTLLLSNNDSRLQLNDGENYFSRKQMPRVLPSDSEKRSLHDQICLMTLGKRRDGLKHDTAESVADFACFLTTGKHLEESLVTT